MKNIFYKKYSHKWQNVLTITHFVFITIFAAALILMKLYNNSFAKSLFFTAIAVAVVYTILKIFANKNNKSVSNV